MRRSGVLRSDTYVPYNSALRQVLLVRPRACSQCGTSGVQIDGHHDDYDKPLEVQWLCKPCHVVADMALRRRERAAHFLAVYDPADWEGDYLTARELGYLLDMPVHMLRGLARSGDIAATKVPYGFSGGQWLFDRGDIVPWVSRYGSSSLAAAPDGE